MKRFPCLLMALALHAQTVKLTVKVVDAVTLAPIPGAQVHIAQVREIQATDTTGSFTIDAPAPNRLWVPEIKAEGYADHDAGAYIQTTNSPLTVTYKLFRAGAISGRIVDADSGEPVANVTIEPLLVAWAKGRREVHRTLKSAVTAKDGTFTYPDLPPGDYALDINSFSADGRRHPVKGYPQIVWPGGGDFQNVAPFNLSYGAALPVGDIKLRKRDLAGLTVTVAGGHCETGQFWDISLEQFSSSSPFIRGFQKAACGDTATFEDVSPGEYEVQAEASWQKDDQCQSGAASILIVEGEEKATVIVTPPLAIHGTLAVDRDAALPPDLYVQLWARGSKLTGNLSHIRNLAAPRVAADGSFKGLSYVPAGGEIQVNLSRLPAAYYVREVRYNGIATPGDTFVIHAGAARQDLAIILSDRAATLTGTVRTADGAMVPDAKVLLAQWPADVVTDYPFGVEEASTTSSGSYSFANLRPATYRAIAVPGAARAKLEEPGAMLALFTSAESFELSEAASASRQLAPVVPR